MTQTQTTDKVAKPEAPDFGPDNFEVVIGTDNVLTIRIDLNRVVGETKSGNNRIASTGGNRQIDAYGTKLGLNVYRTPSGKK